MTWGRSLAGSLTISMRRRRVRSTANRSASRLATGIRAIDSLLTCGKGQRIGIFGGSGVGKSTLLGAMARSSDADVSVIALIGERNREVRDFIEHELGPEGLKKSVLVVATSDRPAPLRIRAAFVALAIAEYFRDQGERRAAGDGFGHPPRHGAARDRPGGRRTAQPEGLHAVGLQSAAEDLRAGRQISHGAPSPDSSPCWWKATISTNPSATRCGPFWTVTSFCRANSARRDIIRPSMYCSRSAGSRRACVRPSKKRPRPKIREAMATHQRSEDLINLGAYASGANPKLDAAIRLRPQLLDFLKQDSQEQAPFEKTMAGLSELAKRADPN